MLVFYFRLCCYKLSTKLTPMLNIHSKLSTVNFYLAFALANLILKAKVKANAKANVNAKANAFQRKI